MSELRFLIVNNHLPHSVVEKGKLDSRVTFPVYQDTEERAIWQRMQGGKDDVFIYDRCGRLAYFIPFPLSIMNTEDALVPTAILATYFQSPCGATCEDDTPPSPLQEFGNDTTEATPDFTTSLYPEYPPRNSSSEEPSDNSTLLENPDFDYPSSFNDSMEEDEETDVYGRHNNNNDLSFVLDRNETSVDLNGTSVDDPLVGFNYNRSNEIPIYVASFSNETSGENVSVTTTTTTTQAPRKKSDRCAEADMSVCRTWSKRKLLRAQTCCSNGVHSAALSESCRNYGKKRCKKIRTVLKCCLKTSYSEANGHASPHDVKAEGHASHDDVNGHSSFDDFKAEGHASKVNTTTGDVKAKVKTGSHSSHDHVRAKVNTFPDDVRAKVNTFPDDVRAKVNSTPDDVKSGDHASHDEATATDDVTIEVTTAVNYVVCCKEKGGQRTCRVSLEGACEAGETVSQDGLRLQTN